MDLNSLFSKHPGFRVAGPEDGERLLKFFDESAMRGQSLGLRYERAPDFFAFLRMQAPESFVFIGEAPAIAAVGTLSIRPGYIRGKAATVGYLGDLRLGFIRRLLVSWRASYGDLLKHSAELPELRGCGHFLTAIIDQNKAAMLALTRGKNSPYHYRELARYRMVSILGRAPWARPAEPGIRVEQGSSERLQELTDFLEKENRPRAFGFRFSEELPRRLKAWPGLRPSSFFVAYSNSGQILGCFAPWSPSPAKRIILESLPWSLRLACAGMRVWRRDAPAVGQELKISYLTHLEIKSSLPRAERESVLGAMLAAAYKAHAFEGAHLVAFSDFELAPLAGGLRGYLTQQTPMTLYQVVPREDGKPDALPDLGTLPPAFEMALV